ncbi:MULTISPECIES: hypothetical protein [Glycomyces]|uniref:Uncharacterized protein n=2 Tax=Glycomyces TaxID=58113 RepID=A0A9X3PIX3_9ACTN|nr:hypothetical protein [Glycomyces lechevalierae]MDA1386361.1 hypothetical protein [Glycomyces lechevalierae]MDR7338877.1 hypothetical protein [Glycomyces lechevalierae]
MNNEEKEAEALALATWLLSLESEKEVTFQPSGAVVAKCYDADGAAVRIVARQPFSLTSEQIDLMLLEVEHQANGWPLAPAGVGLDTKNRVYLDYWRFYRDAKTKADNK